MLRKSAALLPLILLFLGCGHKATEKGPAKHYQLTGKILSVNDKDQTASIDAQAIPNYMEAMTMTYPIADKSEFKSLQVGEEIQATVNVYDSGDYDLSSVKKSTKPANSGK